MAGRVALATLLAGALLQGCWLVVGESFDGYEARPDGADTPLGPYVSQQRTAVNGTRSYTLVRPDPAPASLPLVFSLHGEGQTGAVMRAALPLEAQATTGAVFVYPEVPAGTFDTLPGRTAEAQFVTELIATLASELRVDTRRVFIAGFDDGAIMANTLACRLGPNVVRGVGIAAGTLYPLSDEEFTIDPLTGVASCALPAAILTWGIADPIGTLSIGAGRDTRNAYAATLGCGQTPGPWSVAPCTAYSGCSRPVVWCEIEGLGHEIWPGAAAAMWSFFDGLK
jgi:poly(3-hydroxybutyrate) depolymerase